MNARFRITGSAAAAFALIVLLFGAVPQSAEANDVVNGEVVVAIKGLEIFQGFDLKRKDARIGTKFVGEAFIDEEKVGLVVVSLDYIGVKDQIEVCGGRNDIFNLRIVIDFTAGAYAGERLVAVMRDWSGAADAFWDYTDTVCPLFGVGCNCPPEPAEMEKCLLGGESLIARVGNAEETEEGILMWPGWGTTAAFGDVADIYATGWLCHNYPYVPRFSATLRLVMIE